MNDDRAETRSGTEPPTPERDPEPGFVFRPEDYAVGGSKGLSPMRFTVTTVALLLFLVVGNAVVAGEIDVRALVASCPDARADSRRAATAMIAAARSEGDTRSAAIAEGLSSGDLESLFAHADEYDPTYRMSEAVSARYEALKSAMRFEDRACGDAPRIQTIEVQVE